VINLSHSPSRDLDDRWQDWRPSGSLKLHRRQVEKPWGRSDIASCYGTVGDQRIGEIWFEHPLRDDLPLLIKYLFTSETLSVQVHPNDQQARADGWPRGKSECWYVLDAEPDARIGLGLTKPLSSEELRAAALDGSIKSLMDWRSVKRGDFLFVPAGTIHAIGAGLTLLEIQQNSDATYRLYDYGRARELHLDEAVAVSHARPFDEGQARCGKGTILLDTQLFSVVCAARAEQIPQCLGGRRRWVMPIQGRALADCETAGPGECLLVEPGCALTLSEGAVAIVATEGPIVD
jgi:mannose-6-phosphate isomerase